MKSTFVRQTSILCDLGERSYEAENNLEGVHPRIDRYAADSKRIRNSRAIISGSFIVA